MAVIVIVPVAMTMTMAARSVVVPMAATVVWLPNALRTHVPPLSE